jgi:hypothetical protein
MIPFDADKIFLKHKKEIAHSLMGPKNKDKNKPHNTVVISDEMIKAQINKGWMQLTTGKREKIICLCCGRILRDVSHIKSSKKCDHCRKQFTF